MKYVDNVVFHNVSHDELYDVMHARHVSIGHGRHVRMSQEYTNIFATMPVLHHLNVFKTLMINYFITFKNDFERRTV